MQREWCKDEGQTRRLRIDCQCRDAFRDEKDKVFRTYFVNNRGDEGMGTVWSYLDMTALGRQEEWEDSPEGYPKTPRYKWWRWHDSYRARRWRWWVRMLIA